MVGTYSLLRRLRALPRYSSPTLTPDMTKTNHEKSAGHGLELEGTSVGSRVQGAGCRVSYGLEWGVLGLWAYGVGAMSYGVGRSRRNQTRKDTRDLHLVPRMRVRAFDLGTEGVGWGLCA
eukprot:3378513-Rhodomonas_salina.2